MRYPILKNISNPDAFTAVRLSVMLHGAPPDVITHVLNVSRCPRPLFVLACVLRAATHPGAIVDLTA